MSNLTAFEIIAGTSSILCVFFVIGGFTLKLQRKFRQKRESAEQEFKQELDRLHSAGATVSARTDLGFFVLIELGSLRDSISYYRHIQTAYLVFAVLLVLFASFFFSPGLKTYHGFLIYSFCLLISLLFIISSGIAFIFEIRIRNYTKSYERRIKEIWQCPIDKRVTHTDK